jgi:hypothetical protein
MPPGNGLSSSAAPELVVPTPFEVLLALPKVWKLGPPNVYSVSIGTVCVEKIGYPAKRLQRPSKR